LAGILEKGGLTGCTLLVAGCKLLVEGSIPSSRFQQI
jgi:hypothetical protein